MGAEGTPGRVSNNAGDTAMGNGCKRKTRRGRNHTSQLAIGDAGRKSNTGRVRNNASDAAMGDGRRRTQHRDRVSNNAGDAAMGGDRWAQKEHRNGEQQHGRLGNWRRWTQKEHRDG